MITNRNGLNHLTGICCTLLESYSNEPFLQGKKYGAKLLDLAESLASTSQIQTVSCRTDLLAFYAKRGYTEVGRYPANQFIPEETMTRTGLEMVKMQKTRSK